MIASQRLTKRACDTAEPARGQDGSTKERTLWDGDVKGFGLRVSPKGARAFVVMYRAGRGRAAPLRKITIGPFGRWTVEGARTEARRIIGEVAAGRDPAGDRARAAKGEVRGSVSAAVEEWLRRDQANNRTIGEVRRIMGRDVLPAWGDRALASIRKRDVIELIDGIADRGKKTMANRTLGHVGRLFSWAASRDLIEANPAQYVEKPADEVRRDRKHDDGELVEVWHGLEGMVEPFAAGVRLLILTGARRSEIFEAERGELNGAALHLPATRVKAKEGRIIPLSPPALAIVEALPVFANSRWLVTIDGRYPFSNIASRKAELDRRILAARGPNAEPMPPWRLHDSRRSVATGMQRLGIRLEVIEAVLGHVSGSRAGIVGVYQRHRFTEEARDALVLWGEHLMRLLDPTPAQVVPLRRRAKA